MGNCLWWKREEERGRNRKETSDDFPLTLFIWFMFWVETDSHTFNISFFSLQSSVCIINRDDSKKKGSKKGGPRESERHSASFFSWMVQRQNCSMKQYSIPEKEKDIMMMIMQHKHYFPYFLSLKQSVVKMHFDFEYQKCFFSFSHPKEWLLRWFHSKKKKKEEEQQKSEWYFFLFQSLTQSLGLSLYTLYVMHPLLLNGMKTTLDRLLENLGETISLCSWGPSLYLSMTLSAMKEKESSNISSLYAWYFELW